MKHPGGVIARVEPNSLAARLGLQPGDELLAINDQKVRDVIDVQFYSAEDWLELLVRHAQDGQTRLHETERADSEPLGLDFAHPTFDVDIRRCRNNCTFCFLAQNPPGLRHSLYVKDDDYRYSFLHGNFVTLTNLSDADWARLDEQRLSPLYVSVHATDLELRRQILHCPDAPDVLVQLQYLTSLGIEVHTQLVLVPGLNDGAHLERSLTDLAELAFAPVRSVGIVPLGLTRFHGGPFRPYHPDEMVQVLEQIAPWQARFRRDRGLGWVYPSDEWYLAVGRAVPPSSEYDGFPQIENGIGMVRQFLDGWQEAKSQMRGTAPFTGGRGTLVCGTLITPTMRQLLDELAALTGTQMEVLPVANRFFGPTVSVSGLLTGQDVITALAERTSDGPAFLPCTMFDEAGERTLDDWTPEAIARAAGAKVAVAESLAQVAAQLAPGSDVVKAFSHDSLTSL